MKETLTLSSETEQSITELLVGQLSCLVQRTKTCRLHKQRRE